MDKVPSTMATVASPTTGNVCAPTVTVVLIRTASTGPSDSRMPGSPSASTKSAEGILATTVDRSAARLVIDPDKTSDSGRINAVQLDRARHRDPAQFGVGQ